MLETIINFGYEITLVFIIILGLFFSYSYRREWNFSNFAIKQYTAELCLLFAVLLIFMCVLFWNAEILYYLEEQRRVSVYWYDNYSGVYVYNEFRHHFFYNSHEFISTPFLFFSKIFVIFITSCCLFYSSLAVNYVAVNRIEYPFFFLTALLAMLLLIDSNHLLYSYLALELLNFSIYLLLGGKVFSSLANEASQRYFVYSSYVSALFLLGIALLYGLFGSLNFDMLKDLLMANDIVPLIERQLLLNLALIFIYIALLFKLSLFPFHFWVPEIYEGSSLPTVLFLSTAPKIAILTLFLKVTFVLNSNLYFFLPLIQFLSIASIIYGTVAGLYEYRLKRFLGYSTVVNMGFITLGFSLGNAIGFTAALLYLTIYLLTVIGFFSLLMLFSIEINLYKEKFLEESSELKEIFSLHHFHQHYSYLLAFTILLLSLAGIPPLAGFFIKYYLLHACLLSGNYIVAFIIFILSVIGLGFYLRIIRILYVTPLRLNFHKRILQTVFFTCRRKPLLGFFMVSFILLLLMSYIIFFHNLFLAFFIFLAQTSDYV